MNILWSNITDLPWFLIGAAFVYAIYFIFRTWYIFKKTMDGGFFRGLFDVYLDQGAPIYNYSLGTQVPEGESRKVISFEPTTVKLYHIIWAIIDLPCIVMGACLPFIRRVFSFKLGKLQRPKEEEN